MALTPITNPPMTNTTGLSIVQKLNEIKQAVQPTNPCLDIDISIPANGWSSESPYVYEYTNDHITSGCSVTFDYLEGESDQVLFLDFEKTTTGVRWTAPVLPEAAIPVRIHVLNADATSAMATTADEVSTNAISGTSNVEDALTFVGEDLATLNGNIATINDNLATKVTIIPNFPNAYYMASNSFSTLNKTTKSDIDTYLKSTISSNYYAVFAPLFNMTDGTESGWYLIWRNTNMSGTTQFIKLA